MQQKRCGSIANGKAAMASIFFVGIVSSDFVCMQFEFVKCYGKLLSRYFQNPICIAYHELKECIISGAKQCSVESTPIITNLLETYAATCTRGTEMNNKLRKHNYCISNMVAPGNFRCMRPALREVIKLGPSVESRKYQENHLNMSCRFADEGEKCIQENTLLICGEEGAEFRKQLSMPSIIMSAAACCEIGVQSIYFNCPSGQLRDQNVFSTASPSTDYLSITSTLFGTTYPSLSSAPSDTSNWNATSKLFVTDRLNVTSIPLGTDYLTPMHLGNDRFNVTSHSKIISALLDATNLKDSFTSPDAGHFSDTSSTDRLSPADRFDVDLDFTNAEGLSSLERNNFTPASSQLDDDAFTSSPVSFVTDVFVPSSVSHVKGYTEAVTTPPVSSRFDGASMPPGTF
ncbi:uncharacterized protein NPIL_565091 [Nephila pilipes]|uniref:Uncharacterized protein n=1 Tax=Nephila pilipes TaxID=299642 RepID=A0A8X6TUT8_NEPPI|nr:uncharacterized protein NPIL_565091 [Nephila pilipes]